MTESQCQICIQFEAEDICILSEMLSQITSPISDHKIPIQMFPYIFKSLKFRKCLAQIFDTKYLEICEKCSHNRLQQVFLPLFSSSVTEYNEAQITLQIEEGLDKLYESIQEKQQKLKQSKEQFDKLASQLFNCEDDVEESNSLGEESSSNEEIIKEKNDDDEQQPIMQFNKNSNKNKFQKRSIDILKKWFLDHLDNPYPDNTEKQRLSKITGMHVRQIQNWFTNSRKRYLEPLKKKFEHGLMKESDSQEEDSSKEQKKALKLTQQQPPQQQQIIQPQQLNIPPQQIQQQQQFQQQQQLQQQQLLQQQFQMQIPLQKKVKMEEGCQNKISDASYIKQEAKTGSFPTDLPQFQQPNQFQQFQQMQQLAQLQQLQWLNPLNQLNPLQFQLPTQFLSQYYNFQDQSKAPPPINGLSQIHQVPIFPLLPQLQQAGFQSFLQQGPGQQMQQQVQIPNIQSQIPNLQALQAGFQQFSGQHQNSQNGVIYPMYQQQMQNEQKK
ncbi:unnamed protein product (macronuclear) [Paramecium tetraurelia]|uniref:Homeobox domain-containing protein n=1 Tax=Paramecium tetraurelia TaxID=5888 RepID=A0DYW1_PARTE|nr:uncharacterized protein GSPATT00003196001 [Paramecium tetraurelia]CAK88228.1 unnamed protein product [Paramecium tetraurelia]|eukprot:XP_001455625.1 hypothetical protein (macronuclear) [Paramecium tetraurelia strain d4-2]